MKLTSNWFKYDKIIKARRIIANSSSNDWNDEPEYKLQKVRIYGETENHEYYIIDSYGKMFVCHKSNVFLNKKDFEDKMNNILNFKLLENEKKYLLGLF